MAGIYGNDPMDQYWEKELDDFLNSLDYDDNEYEDDQIVCQECGNCTTENHYSILEEDEEQFLVCPSCGHTFNQ
jgi:protein-arginine kinase activator protein McsA